MHIAHVCIAYLRHVSRLGSVLLEHRVCKQRLRPPSYWGMHAAHCMYSPGPYRGRSVSSLGRGVIDAGMRPMDRSADRQTYSSVNVTCHSTPDSTMFSADFLSNYNAIKTVVGTSKHVDTAGKRTKRFMDEFYA